MLLQAVSDTFSTSRVGVWSLSDKSFKGAPALVLNPSRIEKVRVNSFNIAFLYSYANLATYIVSWSS